jgi:hypothetical protein
MTHHLSRRFILDITADSTIFIRDTQLKEPRDPAALPFFSTDTREQARDLVVLRCRLLYNGNYRLTHPIAYEDLSGLTEMFEQGLQRLIAAQADARG